MTGPAFEVVRTYRLDDFRPCSRCPRLAAAGDLCGRCGVPGGHQAPGRPFTVDVVDWPPGGVVAEQTFLVDVLQRGGVVRRLAGGGLAVSLGDVPADVVCPPDWDRGYQVAGADGGWPTWWPTYSSAAYVARLRQRIRLYPRQGPHWIGPRQKQWRYSGIGIERQRFAHLGVATAVRDRIMRGHRVAFMAFYGYAAETVDHHCKERLCVFPGHLNDSTWEANMAREFLGPEYGAWLRREVKAAPRRQHRQVYTASDPGQPSPASGGGDLAAGLAALAERFGRRDGRA